LTTEDIRNIATVILAAIALVVSLRGYSISKRTEKRAIESSKPIITAGVFPIKQQPGWFHVRWSFENRSSHGYKCNFIEIRRPWFSLCLSNKQARESPENAWSGFGDLRNPLPIGEAKQRIDMDFTLAKAGTASGGPFPAANHWESTYVRISPWSFSRRLSMRVSLSSIDIDERESLFTVKRKIPDVVKNSNE
jgi:hypothetical protein